MEQDTIQQEKIKYIIWRKNEIKNIINHKLSTAFYRYRQNHAFWYLTNLTLKLYYLMVCLTFTGII